MTGFVTDRMRLGAMAGLAILTIGGLAGCGIADTLTDERDEPATPEVDWQEQAAAIDGLVDYTDRPELLSPEHVDTPVDYQVLPPIGGPHHQVWQNCVGDVYDAPIANEHVVHSLEHGAVWITYHPSLPEDHLEVLTSRVAGTDKMLISPFPELDAPISLQAWGYQLKVDRADDPRIDEFIRLLRINAAPEPHATCSGGIQTSA